LNVQKIWDLGCSTILEITAFNSTLHNKAQLSLSE